MGKKYGPAFVFLSLITVSSKVVAGESSNPLLNLILVFLMFVFLALLLDRQRLVYIIKQKEFIFLAAAMIIFFALPTQSILTRLLVLVLFAFFIGKILQTLDSATASLLNALGLTSFLFLIFQWLYKTEPFIWTGLQILTQKTSSILGNITNQQIMLSVTASGLWITVIFLLF